MTIDLPAQPKRQLVSSMAHRQSGSMPCSVMTTFNFAKSSWTTPGFSALARTVSSEVDQYFERWLPHFSNHRSTHFSPTEKEGSPNFSWMTSLTRDLRCHLVSGKPWPAALIKKSTSTMLSSSANHDFSALTSRTDLCPLMPSSTVLRGTWTCWQTCRMDMVSLDFTAV